MTRISLDHPTGFELAADEVVELLRDYPGVVFDGGWYADELVAYTTILPRAATGEVHPFLFFGDVDPAHLGQGFGTLMLGRAVAAAREIHQRDAPTEPVRFGTRALAGRADQADLLRAHGFGLDRHNFLMFSALKDLKDLEDLPAPAMPAGLTLSTFDPADSEELRAAQNRAFADYPSYSEFDELNWTSFMINGSHVRHDQSFVLRDPTRHNAVAAYVFTHEYALAASGEKGREAYVAFVGTCPNTAGEGWRPTCWPTRCAPARQPASHRRASTSTPPTRRVPWGSTSGRATGCAIARTTTHWSNRPGRPAPESVREHEAPPRRAATAPTRRARGSRRARGPGRGEPRGRPRSTPAS